MQGKEGLCRGQRGTVQREKSMFLRKACLGGNITTFEMIPAWESWRNFLTSNFLMSLNFKIYYTHLQAFKDRKKKCTYGAWHLECIIISAAISALEETLQNVKNRRAEQQVVSESNHLGSTMLFDVFCALVNISEWDSTMIRTTFQEYDFDSQCHLWAPKRGSVLGPRLLRTISKHIVGLSFRTWSQHWLSVTHNSCV